MPKTMTLTGNALRQVIHVSVGGDELRLKLSNEFSDEPVEIRSVSIADAAEGEKINPRTVRYLKFDGKESVTIEPHGSVYSDAVKYDLAAAAVVDNHQLRRQDSRARYFTSRFTHHTPISWKASPGLRRSLSPLKSLEHWYNIRPEVMADGKECIAVLGNSITDGRGHDN